MTKLDHTRARGERVEGLVATWLEAQGLRTIDRNVHAAGAELDLVAELADANPRTIVFVEVRSRLDATRGDPLETISPTKRAHLVRAATAWLVAHDLWERVAVRFDCVGVVGPVDTEMPLDDRRVTWVPDAFFAEP